MTKPCEKCGHPGPFIPKNMPHPDPRNWMKVLCAVCGKDVTYHSHQWRNQEDGRWVCCECMAHTKALRDVHSS